MTRCLGAGFTAPQLLAAATPAPPTDRPKNASRCEIAQVTAAYLSCVSRANLRVLVGETVKCSLESARFPLF